MIEVQFRKFNNGDIIAVFPYEIWIDSLVTSYMHVGQHSPAVWFINQSTKAATPEEYADLKAELERIGYELKVIKRRNHARYLEACYKGALLNT
jgi:hypothetical protein